MTSLQGSLSLLVLLAAAHLGTATWFVSDRSPGTDAAWTGFPLDDAWIHQVYSRAIVTTGSPRYNDDVAENGFTSPLWMILGAIPQALHQWLDVPMVPTVKLLGVLLAFLTSVQLVRLLEGLGCRRLTATLSGLLLALSPSLCFSKVSGMEVTLTAATTMAALNAFVRGRWKSAGVLAGLSTLARPEAVIVTAGLVAAGLIGSLALPKERRARVLLFLVLPSVLLLGLWMLYGMAVTGRPLPNTFYVKFAGADATSPTAFFRVVGEIVGAVPPFARWVPGALLGLGSWYLIRRGRPRRVAWLLLCFPWVSLFALVATRDLPSGSLEYFYRWRYLAPVYPFFWLVIGLGIEELGGWTRSDRGRRSLALGAFALLAAGTLPGLRSSAEQFSWNCQNINEINVALGRWISENVAEDEVVAVNDAGALRYFGGRPTVDLMALNDSRMLDEIDQGEWFSDLPLDAKKQWLAKNGIDWLVIFPSWFPDLFQGRAYPMVHYRKADRLTIANQPPPGSIGQDLMAIYRVSGED